MSTVQNKNNNEVVTENTQEVTQETQQVAVQQPVEVVVTEEKEPLHKRVWNKVKKPLAFVAVGAAAFGGGMAFDHFVVGKGDSNQDCNSTDVNTTSEDSEN